MYKKNKKPNARLVYERGKVLPHRPKLNFNKTQAQFLRDPYFYLLDSGWYSYFAFFIMMFISINAMFAGFYCYTDAEISSLDKSNFLQGFFFSVQTFSTVGYGMMSPQNTTANTLVSIQIMVGMLFTAGFTGLFFAKLSKPKVKIMFSKNALIQKQNGQTVLTFRMANQRANAIVMAEMVVNALIDEISAEGEHNRTIKNLKLRRKKTSLFALSWSIYHVIDQDSPLKGLIENKKLHQMIALSAMLTGYDGTQSQTIYKNHFYYPEDIIFDAYFEDIIEMNDLHELSVRYENFHQIKSTKSDGINKGDLKP
ncbi:MAG TPA: ion channel [Oligoflexia bacterium]|nr:ion channel [Oligoflexia bacterium]HMR25692.1 ion channel [Oligoflexia bacterium]